MNALSRSDTRRLRATFEAIVGRDAVAVLPIELDGSAVGLEKEAEQVVAACRENGAREVRVARDEAERRSCGKAGNRPSAPTAACRPPSS